MNAHPLDFEYARQAPVSRAIFRRDSSDFIVDEQLGFSLSGEGEHLWLRIKKINENTDWIAKKLANYFSVRAMDVGYAGKKDRYAETTQWFSVYLPKQSHRIDWSAFVAMAKVDAELIEAHSHKAKLRRGDHQANRFVITLHDVSDTEDLVSRLEHIKAEGAPNYFGEQRFGREGNNIDKVAQWVSDPRSIRSKNLRGIIISAARSYLFNRVLSSRVQQKNWQKRIPGEPETVASGPLWGRGRALVDDQLASLESRVLRPYETWQAALENVGLNQQRRALVLSVNDLGWRTYNQSVEISMTLGPGEYATSVLRELAVLVSAARDKNIALGAEGE